MIEVGVRIEYDDDIALKSYYLMKDGQALAEVVYTNSEQTPRTAEQLAQWLRAGQKLDLLRQHLQQAVGDRDWDKVAQVSAMMGTN